MAPAKGKKSTPTPSDVEAMNLSACGWSRMEEKEQLSHLNDRLAGYINRVRALEKENRRLNLTIKESEEIESRDRKALEDRYLQEIEDLRKALDNSAREASELRIRNDGISAELKDLKERLKHAEPALERAEKQLDSLRSSERYLRGRNETLEADNKKMIEEVKKLKKERDDALKDRDIARRQLEEETLMRSDAENRTLSLKEQLKFEKERHQQVVQEMKERREHEITLATKDVEDEYESRLNEELNASRARLEAQFASRAKSDRDYIVDLQRKYNEANSERNRMQSEVEKLRASLDRANAELDGVRRDYESRLRAAEMNLGDLQAEVDRLTKDYNDLLEIKVRLDHEIDAYRRLLEEEETRLHLTPSPKKRTAAEAMGEGTDGRTVLTAKRRRVRIGGEEVESALAKYQWERESKRFADKQWSNVAGLKVKHDHQRGNYVKLINDGDEDIVLGKYTLVSTAGAHTVKYKFSARQQLKAKAELTVWSSDAVDAEHKPPNSLKMGQQTWHTGAKMRTELKDENGENIAWYETDSTFASHDTYAEDGDQRCALM